MFKNLLTALDGYIPDSVLYDPNSGPKQDVNISRFYFLTIFFTIIFENYNLKAKVKKYRTILLWFVLFVTWLP